MNISLQEKGLDALFLMKPLWQGLNRRHIDRSVYFKDKYEHFTFEKRMQDLSKKFKEGQTKLFMLYDSDAEAYAGYCLCNIWDGKGTVESIYVDDAYRKKGLGGRLMQSALNWFEENATSELSIDVVYANDDALPFYQKYGFFVSTYILKRKQQA